MFAQPCQPLSRHETPKAGDRNHNVYRMPSPVRAGGGYFSLEDIFSMQNTLRYLHDHGEVGATKACTNTKKGVRKHGGSIGAYGLLVGMVSVRFK